MNRDIAYWLQGHVDATRKNLETVLLPLLKMHGIKDVDKNIHAAACALNRLHTDISNMAEPAKSTDP